MCRIFIPGEEELLRSTSRAENVVRRCLTLSEDSVEQVLEQTLLNFHSRHRDLKEHLARHFAAVAPLIESIDDLSENRKLLIGAYLTQEYSFESAAYFNPSIVPHPVQDDLPVGAMRFVMSVRAVGEGHISSIVFRTGVISATGEVSVDPEMEHATTVAKRYAILRNKAVRQSMHSDDLATPDLDMVLGMLPEKFTFEEFEVVLSQLHASRPRDPHFDVIVEKMKELSASSYVLDFSPETDLGERVLWPTMASERNGMEDARWVLFQDDDGLAGYRATYTAFNGEGVTSRVFETRDFRRFTSLDLTGTAVANKGVAFFPRKVGGRYLALSRWDRETNSIAYSDDGYHWNESKKFQDAIRPWELVHIGNSGSPLETSAGWLVITHGAGPMRQYTLGAVLLDLEDPTIVRASLPEPLMVPTEDERNGYVPNVLYSCGGLIHNGTLILPYGFSDSGTRIATANVNELIASMQPVM